MMNFLYSVFGRVKTLLSSFSEGYQPPSTEVQLSDSLKSVIAQCYDTGRLLIIQLTNGDKKLFDEINMPEEDFIVYNAPFNSIDAFDICRFLPVNKLPFAGLFYCQTRDHTGLHLLEPLSEDRDLLKCGHYITVFGEPLYEARARYLRSSEEREELDYIDRSYQDLVEKDEELQRVEKEKQEAEEQVKLLEKRKELAVEQARLNYEKLPPEPEDGPDVILLMINFLGGEIPSKKRKFLKTQTLQSLFDYVYYYTAPNKPLMFACIPQRRLLDMSKTFLDEGIPARCSVKVTQREIDEYSDDE